MKKSISPTDEAVVRITARYVAQVHSGRRPHLSDYLVRYPDYTDELVDFVAYYHALEEHASSGIDASVSCKALSQVSQSALEYAWQHVYLPKEHRSFQLTTLFMHRDRQHLSPSFLAKELDLGIDVVVQLELRSIDPLSIPLELSTQLATALQQPLYAIQTYFAANSRHGVSHDKKSLPQRVAEQQEIYSMPTRAGTQQVSFRQAVVASTQMPDRQKDIWHRIIKQENI